MMLARVEGNVVANRKHPSLEGWRLLVCQPINAAGSPEGSPIVALDPLGAGLHEQVLVSTDGSAARLAVRDPKSPARMMIIGLVDEIAGGTTTPSAPVEVVKVRN
jgi:ethanolamine utilization protein EutN